MAAGLAAICAVPAAVAQTARSSQPDGRGSIVFARADSLWRVAANGDTKAAKLVSLGDDEIQITRIVASPRGTALLIEIGDRVGWLSVPSVPARGQAPSVRILDCTAPAHFAPDGTFVACTGRTGHVTVYTVAADGVGLPKDTTHLASTSLGFADAQHLLVHDQQGLWSESIWRPGQRSLLAPHRPAVTLLDSLLIAPDGRRAVGIYPPARDLTTPGVYAFRLDGKGVRRRLLAGAIPVHWSQDGRWILVQSRRQGACIVRPVGGEYKCWKRFRALALAPDGSYALLAKAADPDTPAVFDLYKGALAGVRPRNPSVVERAVSGPAVWMVAPEQ